MPKNRNQVLNFVAGLLSGGLLGAIAVILLAPQAGSQTRQGIGRKFQEILDAGKQAAADRRQELQLEYQARIQIPLPAADSKAVQARPQ